jgi:hypothetical protein
LRFEIGHEGSLIPIQSASAGAAVKWDKPVLEQTAVKSERWKVREARAFSFHFSLCTFNLALEFQSEAAPCGRTRVLPQSYRRGILREREQGNSKGRCSTRQFERW